jgi:hypothetical protein
MGYTRDVPKPFTRTSMNFSSDTIRKLAHLKYELEYNHGVRASKSYILHRLLLRMDRAAQKEFMAEIAGE